MFFLKNKTRPSMEISLNTILLTLSLTLHFGIITELNAMPPLKYVLSKMLGTEQCDFFNYFFIVGMLFILPLASVTAILCYMKKFLFNSNKDIRKSYSCLCSLYISTILLRSIKDVFTLYGKLSSSKNFYIYWRISNYFDFVFSWITPYEIISGYLLHSAIFIVGTLVSELIIVYNQSMTTQDFYPFCKKHKMIIILISIITIYYFCVIAIVEINTGFLKGDFTSASANMISRLYESTLICILGHYMYVILGTNGLL